MKTAAPSAVVSISVKAGANAIVSTDGLMAVGRNTSRGSANGGLSTNTDFMITARIDPFGEIDLDTLQGREVMVAQGGKTFSARIMSTKLSAWGEIFSMTFGSYERVF